MTQLLKAKKLELIHEMLEEAISIAETTNDEWFTTRLKEINDALNELENQEEAS